jgi:hypothetical protein
LTAIGLRLNASGLYAPLTQRNGSRGPADHGGTMVNEWLIDPAYG